MNSPSLWLNHVQEKKALREEKLKQEEKYMWAVVDGVKEKVAFLYTNIVWLDQYLVLLVRDCLVDHVKILAPDSKNGVLNVLVSLVKVNC
jgi:hypothetical protein